MGWRMTEKPLGVKQALPNAHSGRLWYVNEYTLSCVLNLLCVVEDRIRPRPISEEVGAPETSGSSNLSQSHRSVSPQSYRPSLYSKAQHWKNTIYRRSWIGLVPKGLRSSYGLCLGRLLLHKSDNDRGSPQSPGDTGRYAARAARSSARLFRPRNHLRPSTGQSGRRLIAWPRQAMLRSSDRPLGGKPIGSYFSVRLALCTAGRACMACELSRDETAC